MNKLQTTLNAVNAGENFAVLVGKTDIFPYENGKKISDERIGVKLNIALHNSRLSQLTVKFETDPIPKITDEAIVAATESCDFLFVELPDTEVTIYSSSNGMAMSATGKTARIVTFKEE